MSLVRMAIVAAFVLVAPSAGRAEEGGPSSVPAYRQGTLFLVDIGISSAPTRASSSPGPHVTAMLGRHLSPTLSLNGGIGLNTGRNEAADSITEWLIDYTFMPLLHLGSAEGELVVGPKIGRFQYRAGEQEGETVMDRASGWIYGANVGLLLPVQSMALGIFFSYGIYRATQVCDGHPVLCHQPEPGGGGELDVVTFGLGLLY